MWTRLVTDENSSGPLVGDAIAAVVRRTGARSHLPRARDGAAETANGAVERMVLRGLTAAYYTISAAMRLQCGRNPIRRATCRAEALARRDCRTTCRALPPRPLILLAISSLRRRAGPGILTLRQCPKTSVEIYSC